MDVKPSAPPSPPPPPPRPTVQSQYEQRRYTIAYAWAGGVALVTLIVYLVVAYAFHLITPNNFWFMLGTSVFTAAVLGLVAGLVAFLYTTNRDNDRIKAAAPPLRGPLQE
jgi:Co/Zn/Cd efflux system component